MNDHMAKLADYGPFENEARFLGWVKTNYGTNVSQMCSTQISAALGNGQKVIATDVLEELISSTRQVDVAKNGFKAQFRW